MAATVAIAPALKQKFFDNGGVTVAGGKLFTYVSGTSTKQATYTDSTGNTANANPVILDALGQANVFLDTSLTYKFVLAPATDTDPPTSPIWTLDGIKAIGQVGGPNGSLSPANYGAVLDGTTHLLSERYATLSAAQAVYPFATSLSDTIDWAAVQACFNAALSQGRSVWHTDGTAVSNRKVTLTGWVDQFGPGSVTMTDATQPLFEFTINADVTVPRVVGPTFNGPQTSNATSTCFRFLGNNTSFFQHGFFRFACNGFGSIVKDEKSPRTTSNGLEAQLNWNVWKIKALNQGVAGIWCTQGSGTGNEFEVNGLTLYAGAPILRFGGVGCVVGDILASGHWGCQAAGGVGVWVEDSTNYRAQIDITRAQFDANCDIPLKLGAAGATLYRNITMVANNFGGNASLGPSLQPLYSSDITDRDVSSWRAGNAKQIDTTGAQTVGIFSITLQTVGATSFKLMATGTVGGVGSCSAVAEYDIREGGGVLTVAGPYNNRTSGGVGGLALSITTSGTVATVNVTYTPSAAGTRYNVTLMGSGEGFKVTRL